MCTHVFIWKRGRGRGRGSLSAQLCTLKESKHTNLPPCIPCYHTLKTHHIPIWHPTCYGVATISRLLKITSHFCKRALQKRPIIWTSLLIVATPYVMLPHTPNTPHTNVKAHPPCYHAIKLLVHGCKATHFMRPHTQTPHATLSHPTHHVTTHWNTSYSNLTPYIPMLLHTAMRHPTFPCYDTLQTHDMPSWHLAIHVITYSKPPMHQSDTLYSIWPHTPTLRTWIWHPRFHIPKHFRTPRRWNWHPAFYATTHSTPHGTTAGLKQFIRKPVLLKNTDTSSKSILVSATPPTPPPAPSPVTRSRSCYTRKRVMARLRTSQVLVVFSFLCAEWRNRYWSCLAGEKDDGSVSQTHFAFAGLCESVSADESGCMCVIVCVCARVFLCMCMYMYVCVCPCVCASVCVMDLSQKL